MRLLKLSPAGGGVGGGIEGQEYRMTAEQHDFTLMVFQKTKVLRNFEFISDLEIRISPLNILPKTSKKLLIRY